MFLLSLLHFFHPSLIPSLSLSHTHSSSLPPYRLHCTALSYRDLLTKKSANFRSPIYRSHVNEKGTLTHSFRPTKDMQSGNCWFTILRKARNLLNHGILLSSNNRSFCFIIQISKINPFERFLEM
ncbi:dubious [Schizosaccharomyces pombe]|uniref:Uncharacterized protein C1399.06 n=1 Tax=Schizosaccharomyces pombe (strain 972 / ATCC 24843) TaxID=284812 RepID=YI36_SCHPO|nr:uncharacterized protein SPAC1399.06 [Schizosaccharomyces pombe]G2TRK4.1 RecName: Full=Uncharacterized protein C1399.06; Flags: Precursor [Schizosaccharomyces pombe 972h-]CCD31313.1 sequence orphan [Schizosaccharomyces pombe]|eukprot:NP_001343103.1 uncharacterized protein SPAC1399.06 [Schizosaccharomyces pombe]